MTRFLTSIVVAAALLASCASPSTKYDDTTYLVFFGRNIGMDGNEVSEAQWTDFEQTVITKALPAYTVTDGLGGRLPVGSNAVAHEKTKVLIYVALEAAASAEQIDSIVQRYKDDFSQESVLVVRQSSDATFE